MVRYLDIGLQEALGLTLEALAPLDVETVTLLEGLDRVVAEDLYARVDSPSLDASLKDGYAVMARDVAAATPEQPVRLRLLGTAPAGSSTSFELQAGTTVRILTGARIPSGADAVLSEEFVTLQGGEVLARNHAESGRNILPRGSDVADGRLVVARGQCLTPGQVGLLAAAGHSNLPVFRSPKVGIIATGDEVVAPGQPLPDGKLYASNITALSAWCRRYGMATRTQVIQDNAEIIQATLESALADGDAIITSGGAWTGDRDLVARVLNHMGWRQMFHRIRIGPGKAVGFGLLHGIPVFILPGGPPSNLMGFLQIALPGLLKLKGCTSAGLPLAPARPLEDLVGRHADWTQFIFGTLVPGDDVPRFQSLRTLSRLQSMAEATAVASIPEGLTRISAGSLITVQMLV